MVRSPLPVYAACGVTTLIALTPLMTFWEDDPALGRLVETDGRVQLAIDEQEVGDVDPNVTLEVCFLVTNAGNERLLLRQAPGRSEPNVSGYPLYTVSPGRTIAVLARLNSNELASRGQKHVRFDTSDTTCPELWLTVRGNVAGNFAPVGR